MRTKQKAPRPPAGLAARRFDVDGVPMAILWFPLLHGARELTEAEHDIAGALLAGRSNAEIARQRGTSVRTVANQVACVYQKLGVRSRSELAARAVLLGGTAAPEEDAP